MNRRRKVKKTIFLWFSFIFFSILVGVGYFIVDNILFTKNTVDNIYKKSNTTTSGNKIDTLTSESSDLKISVLLIGVDNDSEREATEGVEGARSDTLIYLTYNGKNKTINMVSIPRDTWVDIYDGTDNLQGQNKINSAYNLGKEDATISTVKHFLNLPVDYYATVNFISFKKIIDAVGGIEINVPFDINTGYASDNSGETIVAKGLQTLNGEQALAYSRIRKIDNDIERGKRQQEVIKATINKTLTLNSLTKYKSILNSVSGDTQTNLTFNNLITIAQGAISGVSIESNAYEYTDGYVGEQSVVYVTDDSYNTIREKLLTELGLSSDYTNE